MSDLRDAIARAAEERFYSQPPTRPADTWELIADDILALLPEHRDELMRAMPCPYVRTSDEGTVYCSLAEGTA